MSKADDLSYQRTIALWGIIGLLLFGLGHTFIKIELDTLRSLFVVPDPNQGKPMFELEPFWLLTPLYILPVGIGLIIAGRLKVFGLIVITLAVTIAHWLAQEACIATLGPVGGAVEALFKQNDVNEGPLSLIVYAICGAVAGAVGAVVSFVSFASLRRNLRLPDAGRLYAGAVLGLSVTGALGIALLLGTEYFGEPEGDPRLQSWLRLYLLWQIAFTISIAQIFRRTSAAEA